MDLSLPDNVSAKLMALAEKYENRDFIKGDPSFSLYVYFAQRDTEVFSLITAMLSFGKRDQFLKKVGYIQSICGSSPYEWIKSGQFRENFLPKDKAPEDKFYRFYSYSDMLVFFEEIRGIIRKENIDGLGDFFHHEYLKDTQKHLSQIISESFPESKIVPKGKCSACKRIHMFLRWMVRRDSPVDRGFWKWYSPADLIIPLDTHVLQESIKLGLVPPDSSPSFKTAVFITEKLKLIWPDDPVKGDFSLFGVGINW